MNCPNRACNAENPETNHYCGMCGTPLDAEQERIERAVDCAVTQQMDKLRCEFVRESDNCEFRLAENVQNRVMDWAKMFLWWAGVPIGIAVAIVGIQISDLRTKIEQSATEANKTVADSKTSVTLALTTAGDAKASADKLKNDINEAEMGLDIIDVIISMRSDDYREAARKLDALESSNPETANDERIFGLHLYCFRCLNNFSAAALLASERFPAKAKLVSTYIDAGYALMVGGVTENPEQGKRDLEKAIARLEQAKTMLELASDGDEGKETSVDGNLAMCYAFLGDPKAREYALKWKEAAGKPWNDPTEKWFTPELAKKVDPLFAE